MLSLELNSGINSHGVKFLKGVILFNINIGVKKYGGYFVSILKIDDIARE